MSNYRELHAKTLEESVTTRCLETARLAMEVVIMTDSPLVRFFWRVFDRLDYWLTQARLWLADAVCDPEP